MENGGRWSGGGRAILFYLVLTAARTTVVDATRPEVVLANVLTRPFVPREFASPECVRDASLYLRALQNYTPWALQMYDSSAKIPAGLITGSYKQLGNFDECLRARSDHGFVGQACRAAVRFEITADDGAPRAPDLGDLLVNVAVASNATRWTSGNTVVYEWMWCVPSTCRHSEIQEALEIALDPLKVEGRVDMVVNVPKEFCQTVETVRVTWDAADICYTSILVLFALSIIANTGYDIATQRGLVASNPKVKVILTSFSLYTNGKNLLRTDRRQGYIKCLDGLRFLSICWIIYGHTYYLEVMGVKMNLTQIPTMYLDWSKMLLLNANIITDTFFLLSGIVLAYAELSKKEERENTNFFLYMIALYVHRYVRLTPAYAMMIGFYATLFYKFGMGPHWDNWVGSNRDFCRENWWTNLLYINNFVNVPKMCMSQSWYLSTDMQLVWLSPLILYPMLKLRRVFFATVFGIVLFLSGLVPFVITCNFKLTGTMLYKEQSDVADVYLQIYTKVYNRFGPYVIGLGLGYLLHTTRSYNVKLRTWCVICGWLIAIAAGLSVVLGPRNMYAESYVYDQVEAGLYAALHRQVFALAVSWIIFCCVHGYAGPVNHLLSWPGWMPLANLTYCAYLCHYVFLLSDVGSVRTVGDLTPMNALRAFFANLMCTMILSALWSLCFEMPFMVIDRALFSGRKPAGRSGRQIRRSTENSKSLGTAGEKSSASIAEKSYGSVALRVNAESGDGGEPGEIYIIGTNKQRDAAARVAANTNNNGSATSPDGDDGKKPGHVDRYCALDVERPRRSLSEKALDSLDNDRTSRSLRDSG